MQDNEIQNLLRIMNRIGKTTRHMVVIEDTELANGEMIDKEIRSSVINGNVEINDITHNRVLGCGHIASSSSVVALCDICRRMVCQSCIFLCDKCHVYVCNHCSKVYTYKDEKKVLCTMCHWDTKRKDNLGKVFGFFVKTKEEK